MLIVILICVVLTVLLSIRMSQRRRSGQRLNLRDRFIRSLIPAMLGAGLGFAYASHGGGGPESLGPTTTPAMYSSMGAVLRILAVRVGTLLIVMYRDFFGGDG